MGDEMKHMVKERVKWHAGLNVYIKCVIGGFIVDVVDVVDTEKTYLFKTEEEVSEFLGLGK